MLVTKEFITLFIINLLTVASYATFFLLPLFIAAHGGSEQQIGWQMGIFAFASAACRPWISELIDRWGRRHCYLTGALLMTLMPLCYIPFIGSQPFPHTAFAILRIVHGVGLALSFTTVFTWVADIVPKQRLNEGLGIFGISGLVGLAAGPALAEPILLNWGFQHFFIMAASLALFSLLLILSCPARSKPAPNAATAVGFFRLLFMPAHRRYATLAFLFGIGLAAPGSFIAPFLHQHQLPPLTCYYVAYAVAAIMVRLFAGRLFDRIGEARIIPWGLFITAAGVIAITLIEGLKTITLAGLIIGTGHGVLFPALNSLTVRHSRPEVRGKMTGIFTGALDSGIFLGSIVLGYIGEQWGWPPLFGCAGVLVLCGIPLAHAIHRQKCCPFEIAPAD